MVIRTRLGGVVSVSATDVMAAHLLPPLVRQLREKEPTIAIEVIASDAVSDLLRREADIAMTELFGGFGRDFYAAYQAAFQAQAARGSDAGSGNDAQAAMIPASPAIAKTVKLKLFIVPPASVGQYDQFRPAAVAAAR